MNVWDIEASLKRAQTQLGLWPKQADPSLLLHAALDLRLALELYVMQRYEKVAGEAPEAHGANPGELFMELALFNEEAMTPQSWSLGVEMDTRGNPSLQTMLGISFLRFAVAREFYVHLTELLHAGLQYESTVDNPAFWEKEYHYLSQVHKTLSDLATGHATKPDHSDGFLEPGQAQSDIL